MAMRTPLPSSLAAWIPLLHWRGDGSRVGISADTTVLQSMPDVLRVKQADSGLASPFVCVLELTELKWASVGVRRVFRYFDGTLCAVKGLVSKDYDINEESFKKA
jgi:hypothetical protein